MDDTRSLESGMRYRVYWITKRIAQGQFVTPERAAVLCDQGVTDILNVGEGESVVAASDFGFHSVVDVPVVDLELIPPEVAVTAMDALHKMLEAADSRVFVHCVAGQNRSPTILWLYFVACGLAADDARVLIARRSPDAVPGHGRMIDEHLVNLAQSHGELNYQPLADPSVLEPAY